MTSRRDNINIRGFGAPTLALALWLPGDYDTLAASRKHFGYSLPNHQLQTVAAACGYDLENHHHALADAEACAHIAIMIL